MTLQLHQPDGRGGLVPTPPAKGRGADWREGLLSRRWRAARLGNTDMNPTSSLVAVAFWLVLAGLTFALLVWGYGSHFWH
ncbi:MAG TPA: hypothetical protein VF293_06015 [Candidatus Limnocylindrales bacterium]